MTNDEKTGQRGAVSPLPAPVMLDDGAVMNPPGLKIVVKIGATIAGKIVGKIVAKIVVMSSDVMSAAMSDATSDGTIAVTIEGRIAGTIEEMNAGKPGGMSPAIAVRRHPRAVFMCHVLSRASVLHEVPEIL